MTSPSIVRPACPADRDEIWRLFKLHHAENALFPLSEKKADFLLNRVLNPSKISDDDSGPRGIAGVIGSIGSLEGAIILVLGSPWYTDHIGVDDCMNFVDLDHRKSGHAKALISYAKNMVDIIRSSGHPNFKMIVGIISTKRTAPKIRLYSQQLELVGAYYMYPSTNGAMPLKNMHRID